MLAAKRPALRPARLFGLLERRCAPRPLVPPSSRRDFSLSFLDPVRERLANLIKPAPLPALPPLPPRWDGRRIPKEEFNQLLPDEQIRYALSLPVPTTFPQLGDKRMTAIMFGGAHRFMISEVEERKYRAAYHPEQLEWVGDAHYGLVIRQVMVELRPLPHYDAPDCPSLLAHEQDANRLATNEIAEKLARQVGLDKTRWLGKQISVKPVADQFEAYLDALYRTRGLQALYEFLVPLLRDEYRTWHHRPAVEQDGPSSDEEAPSFANIPVDLIPDQVSRAPDYSANVVQIRRSKPHDPFRFPTEYEAVRLLFSYLSRRSIPFAWRWEAGRYFVDVVGSWRPLVFPCERGTRFPTPKLVWILRKYGIVEIDSSITAKSSPPAASSLSSSKPVPSSAASETPPASIPAPSQRASPPDLATAPASATPAAPPTPPPAPMSSSPSSRSTTVPEPERPDPETVSALPASLDSNPSPSSPSTAPALFEFEDLTQAGRRLGAAIQQLTPQPTRRFTVHLRVGNKQYTRAGSSILEASHGLVKTLSQLPSAEKLALSKHLPVNALEAKMTQKDAQTVYQALVAQFAGGNSKKGGLNVVQLLTFSNGAQVSYSWSAAATSAVRRRSLARAAFKAGLISLKSRTATAAPSPPSTSLPASSASPPSSIPSTSSASPTSSTPSTSTSRPTSSASSASASSVSSATPTNTTAESAPTKPLPFRFSSLEDGATNLRAALERRKYHFKVDIKRTNRKNTVFTLSVKEWSKTIKCSLVQSRLGASRAKEKKQLPVPLIEECVRRGVVVIEEPLSPSPDSPTSSFLDNFLVDSPSANSTSTDPASSVAPSSPLCTSLSPAPPSPAPSSPTPPPPVPQKPADSLSPPQLPPQDVQSDCLDGFEAHVAERTRSGSDVSSVESDTPRHGLISRNPPLFHYRDLAMAASAFPQDLAAAFPQALKREFRLRAPDRPHVVGVSYVNVRDAWSALLRAGEEVGYFVKHPDTSSRQAFTVELPLHYRPQDVAGPHYPFLSTLKNRALRPYLTLEASFTVQIDGTSFELLGPAPLIERKVLAQIFHLCLHRGMVTLDYMSSYSRPATFAYTVVDTPPAAASPSSDSAAPRSPSPPPTPLPTLASPSPTAPSSYHDLLAFYSSSSSGDSPDLPTSVDLAESEPVETPSSDELDAELAELAAIEAFLGSHVEVDESNQSASNARVGVEATTGSSGDRGADAERTPAIVEVEQEGRVEVDSVAVERPATAPIEARDDDAAKVANDTRVAEKPFVEREEETKPLRAQSTFSSPS